MNNTIRCINRPGTLTLVPKHPPVDFTKTYFVVYLEHKNHQYEVPVPHKLIGWKDVEEYGKQAYEEDWPENFEPMVCKNIHTEKVTPLDF